MLWSAETIGLGAIDVYHALYGSHALPSNRSHSTNSMHSSRLLVLMAAASAINLTANSSGTVYVMTMAFTNCVSLSESGRTLSGKLEMGIAVEPHINCVLVRWIWL